MRNNRFSQLVQNNNNTNKDNRFLNNSKKKSVTSFLKKESNEKNMFISRTKFPVKKEFNITKENFPTIGNNQKNEEKNEEKNDEIENYLEKTKKEKIKKLKKEDTKLGWTTLKFNNNHEIIINSRQTIFNKDIKNHLYKLEYKNKKYNANLIIDNRIKQREELNEILGDISPYWNTSVLIPDDYMDSYYNDYYEWSSESENEYYEE